MNEAHAAITTQVRRLSELDLPRVLLAAPARASASLAQSLGDAGYAVTTAGADPVRDLRRLIGVELFVLDTTDTEASALRTVETVRSVDWALPIILIARPDPALRSEARRLGVEAIIESPLDSEELRRVALELVPAVPEAVLDLTG